MTPNAIADHFDVTRQAISKHLRILSECELVKQEQQGREMRDGLRQAMAGLSPRAAEVFALRFIEGYGNKEIAGMLGTSQTAIGVSLHRTRAQLRDELGSFLGEQS